jgi:adenylosuccinate synthase
MKKILPGLKGAVVVMGAQWGDECKGKISAYLTRVLKTDVYKTGSGPNAEHGIFYTTEGPYLKVNQLPLGWMFSPKSLVRIGHGVVVDPKLLLQEIKRYGLGGRVKIDNLCPILVPADIKEERTSAKLKNIGSTLSGTGACKVRHIRRQAQLARDIPELASFCIDVEEEASRKSLTKAIVIESTQGSLLSLDSVFYPNTTSKNISAANALDDIGLPVSRLGAVMLCVKAMPTREGAGPMGSKELSTAEIKKRGLIEYSSIGGVVRRKSEGIDWKLLMSSIRRNEPTEIALTFLDHFDPQVNGITDVKLITDRVWKLVEKVQKETGVPVTILETGKTYNCLLDLSKKRRFDVSKIHRQIILPKTT